MALRLDVAEAARARTSRTRRAGRRAGGRRARYARPTPVAVVDVGAARQLVAWPAVESVEGGVRPRQVPPLLDQLKVCRCLDAVRKDGACRPVLVRSRERRAWRDAALDDAGIVVVGGDGDVVHGCVGRHDSAEDVVADAGVLVVPHVHVGGLARALHRPLARRAVRVALPRGVEEAGKVGVGSHAQGERARHADHAAAHVRERAGRVRARRVPLGAMLDASVENVGLRLSRLAPRAAARLEAIVDVPPSPLDVAHVGGLVRVSRVDAAKHVGESVEVDQRVIVALAIPFGGRLRHGGRLPKVRRLLRDDADVWKPLAAIDQQMVIPIQVLGDRLHSHRPGVGISLVDRLAKDVPHANCTAGLVKVRRPLSPLRPQQRLDGIRHHSQKQEWRRIIVHRGGDQQFDQPHTTVS